MLDKNMLSTALKEALQDVSEYCDDIKNDLDSTLNSLGIGTDDIIDNAGALVPIYKIWNKINSHRQLENFKNFLTEVEHGIHNREALDQQITDLSDQQTLNKDLSKLTLITTEYDNTIKSILLGKLYINFLRGHINKKELFRLANLLNTFLIDDIKLLHYIVNERPTNPEQVSNHSGINRLSSLGLINNESTSIFLKFTDGDQPPLYHLLNDGKLLYNYSIKEYLDENPISAE